jgi:hypothetical protein
MNPIPSQTGTPAFPFGTYHEYLDSLADIDKQYGDLARHMENFKKTQTQDIGDGDVTSCAKVAVLDVVGSNIQETLSIDMDCGGQSLATTSQAMVQQVMSVSRPQDSKLRLLIHICYSKGPNYSLLDALGCKYAAHPDLFLPHSATGAVFWRGFPSQRKVLCLKTEDVDQNNLTDIKFLFTAQSFADATESGSNTGKSLSAVS